MITSNKRIRTNLNRLQKYLDFPESYEELQTIICNLYKLSPKEIRNMNITYIDDEGDKVSVSNTFDLHQARIFIEKEDPEFLDMDIYLPEAALMNSQFGDLINETTLSISEKINEKELNLQDYTEIFKKIEEINLNDDVNLRSIKFNEEENEDDQDDKKSLKDRKIKKKPLVKEKAYYLKKRNRKLSKHSDESKKEELKKENLEKEDIKKEGIKLEQINKEKEPKKIISSRKESSSSSEVDELDEEKLEEIVSNLVKKKMDAFKEKLIEKTKKKTDKLLKKMLKKKQKPGEMEEKDKQIHRRVCCDGCGVHPIIGVRYKCSVCENFDYCEDCEEKMKDEHEHPFIKMRKPEVGPFEIKCTLPKSELSSRLRNLFNVFSKKEEPIVQKQTIDKNSNILFNNFITKDRKNLSEKEKSEYFLDLVKNMKMLYDLSSVDDSVILESLTKANGNIDEALILLAHPK